MLKRKSLSFLKSIIIGGAALNQGNEERINNFLKNHNSQISITKGYGMTEMCAVMTYTCLPQCNSIGSVGIPLVKNNVAIVDTKSGVECKYDEIGEIFLTGPTMMKEYFNNSEETKEIQTEWNGGKWVKTGDLGYMNKNGELFHKGRIKRMITFEGHNIFPSVIEDVLSKHPLVKDVSVIGIKYAWSHSNEVPTAFVVVNDTNIPQNDIIEKLQKHSQDNLPQRDVAQRYVIVGSIPITPNGKVDSEKMESLAKASIME